MDQMMGDSWGRTRYVSRRTSGFSPNVDVYYRGDPQQAVVVVDLAGVELSEVGIEVGGRHLAIVGERPVQETEGRVYQQVEIPSGPFRRVVELQVEVDAERARRPTKTACCGSSCRCGTLPRPPAGCRSGAK